VKKSLPLALDEKYYVLAHFRGKAVYFEHDPFRAKTYERRVRKMRKWLLAVHKEMRESLMLPAGMQPLEDGGADLSIGSTRPPLPPGCIEVYL